MTVREEKEETNRNKNITEMTELIHKRSKSTRDYSVFYYKSRLS